MASAKKERRTLLGREGELATLVGRAELALGGRGSMAIILGEPGSGKTLLAEGTRRTGTRLGHANRHR